MKINLKLTDFMFSMSLIIHSTLINYSKFTDVLLYIHDIVGYYCACYVEMMKELAGGHASPSRSFDVQCYMHFIKINILPLIFYNHYNYIILYHSIRLVCSILNMASGVQ